jgi:hypothetical protein
MSPIQQIRVRSEMPCTIQPNHPQQRKIAGVTKDLSRDSVSVLICGKPAPAWLQRQAEIIIQVALPFRHNFQPKSLEIRAVVAHLNAQGDASRVTATVRGMTFVDRDDTATNSRNKTYL